MLKMNTKVHIETLDSLFDGVIVGKAYNTISESYIIKCTDGFIPNNTYEYDTVIIPLVFYKGNDLNEINSRIY